MRPLLGFHAVVDGFTFDPSPWSEDLCRRFCLDAVELAEMTLISGPVTATATPFGVDGALYMGIAILAESHVTIHLDTTNKSAHVDLFSCKPFDFEAFTIWTFLELGLTSHRAALYRRDAPHPQASTRPDDSDVLPAPLDA